MPKDTGELVEVLTGQPELFRALDVETPVVRAASEHVINGKTTSKHHHAVARIIAAASLGWSIRQIAERLGHSRHTVRAVLRTAERAGKVAPLRERVLQAAAEAVHEDIQLGDRIREQAEAGADVDLAALAALRRATWIGAGILGDKLGGAGGPAVQVNVQVAGSATQVQVQEYVERLRRLAPESGSGVHGEECPGIGGPEGVLCPPVSPTSAGESAREAGRAQAQAPTGGGGVERDAGGGGGDRKP